jgi:nitrate reductase NapE
MPLFIFVQKAWRRRQRPSGRPPTPLQPIPTPLPPSTRTEELRSFLFFTVVMAPLLAVIGVGGFGFVVWMYQLVAGPPAG